MALPTKLVAQGTGYGYEVGAHARVSASNVGSTLHYGLPPGLFGMSSSAEVVTDDTTPPVPQAPASVAAPMPLQRRLAPSFGQIVRDDAKKAEAFVEKEASVLERDVASGIHEVEHLAEEGVTAVKRVFQEDVKEQVEKGRAFF